MKTLRHLNIGDTIEVSFLSAQGTYLGQGTITKAIVTHGFRANTQLERYIYVHDSNGRSVL